MNRAAGSLEPTVYLVHESDLSVPGGDGSLFEVEKLVDKARRGESNPYCAGVAATEGSR
jgi:hypothetical protein